MPLTIDLDIGRFVFPYNTGVPTAQGKQGKLFLKNPC